MIDETANCLEDGKMSKLAKRGYLEIYSQDKAGVIAEEGMEDAVSGSDNCIQFKMARIGNSLRHIGFDMADPNLSSSNGGLSSPVDTFVEPSSSQNSSALIHVPATTMEKENSLETEADAVRTTSLSDNKLGEQIEQRPEKSDCSADVPNLICEEIMTGNGQSNIIVNLCSSDELVNNLTKQVQAKRKKLLVLDINGLLADILSSIPKDYKSDINIARRAIFRRPFCSEFLTFCFETFEVGIWSSRTQKNVERVIDFLLGDLKDRLLFCWDITQCTPTGFRSLENWHKTLMFKEIRKLWEPQDHGLPWQLGHFNASNTLLVDDSPYKALLNPPYSAVFPQSYSYQNRHDMSLGPGGDIRAYLEGVATSDNVQQYVEENPFGQGFLSPSSPSWDHYYKAVISLFTLLTPSP